MSTFDRHSPWLRPLLRSPILRILTGAASGQLLTLVASPLILRIFSPEEFGLFTLLNSIAAATSVLLTLRYELAVPVPEKESEAFRIAMLAIFGAVSLTVIATIATVFTAQQLGAIGRTLTLGSWYWLIPGLAASVALNQIGNLLAIRQKRYRAIAYRSITQAVVTVACQAALGLAGMGITGLIVGFAFGQVTTAVLLFRGSGLWHAAGGHHLQSLALQSIARRYANFPLHLAPAGLLNTVSLQVPIFLITYWYGIGIAGQFGLAVRLLTAPVTILTQAVANVFLAQFAEAVRNREPRSGWIIFRQMSVRTALAGLAVGALVIAFSKPCIPLIFGPKWAQGGALCQALAISVAAQVFASPLSQTLIMTGRTSVQLWFDASRLVLVLGSISLGATAGLTVIANVWVYSILSSITYIVFWLLCRRSAAIDNEA